MKRSCVIFLSPELRIALISAEDVQWITIEASENQSLSEAIAQAVSDTSLNAEHYAIVLPDDTCLPAQLEKPPIARHELRQVLTYQMEELLPLSAESYEADFIDHQDHVLGIATPHASCKQLILTLAEHGKYVQLISSQTLILLESQSEQLLTASYAVLHNSECAHLFEINNRKPISWIRIPNQHLQQQLPLQLQSHELPQLNLDQPVDGVTHLHVLNNDTEAFEPFIPIDKHHDVMATQVAMLLNKHKQPWINLNRGILNQSPPLMGIRKSLVAAGLSLAVLLVASIGALVYKGSQYSRHAEQYHTQATNLYKDTLNNQIPPPTTSAMRLRLDSQHRLLLGLKGKANNQSDSDSPQSAYLTFYQLLANLPQQMRFNLHSIQIDSRQIYLEGQARSHSDAENIAQSTRKIPNANFASPKTENLKDKGVAFRLTGTVEQPGVKP